MKSKILISLIEQIVVKEVRKQLPILLQECLTPPVIQKPSIKIEDDSSLKHLLEQSEVEEQPRIKPPVVVKKYSTNPMVNQILNETVNDLGLRESGRSPSVGLDGSFTKLQADGGILNESATNIPNLPLSPSVPVSILDTKDQNPEVEKLMKWDFSAILKKSKEKRN